MIENKPQIIMEYDTLNYSDEQIRQIEDGLSQLFEVQKRTVVRKSMSPPSFFLLILLSAPVTFFSKSFFTRIGEKLGNEVGDDLQKVYRSVKKKIGKVLTKPKSGNIPTIIFQFPLSEKDRGTYTKGIKGCIKTDDEVVLEECFDQVEELYHLAKATLAKMDRSDEVLQIIFEYDQVNKIWRPSWCNKIGTSIFQYRNGGWERTI